MSAKDIIAIVYGCLMVAAMVAAVIWTVRISRRDRRRAADEAARPWEPMIYTAPQVACHICRLVIQNGSVIWCRQGRMVHDTCLPDSARPTAESLLRAYNS